MAKNITGRDSVIISEALAFAYAAMKQLPQMFQPTSDMEDTRELLFGTQGERAEFWLGKAMLLAWNLRADVPPSLGLDREEFIANLRRIREQVLQEPPDEDEDDEREGPSDTDILVRYIDGLLRAEGAGRRE